MTRFGSVRLGRGLVVGLALALAPAAAAAQGSAIHTQSGCMSARNGAGVAAPCRDGSAVYYNPAALVRHNGAVSAGVTLIDQSGTFVFDTTAREVERAPRSRVLPHGWATYRLSPRLGVGLGVWAPYDLSMDWPVCAIDQARCGIGFEGRFVGYDQSLRGLYFQPTVAYDLVPGRVALGVGLDVVKGDVDIRRRLDLSEQVAGAVSFAQLGVPQGTDFADLRLSGDGWGVTGHIGALIQVTSAISIGARYMHSVELTLDGRADFTQVPTSLSVGPLPPIFPTAGTNLDQFLIDSGVFEDGPVTDQDVSTSVTLPAQAVAGVAIQLDPTLRVMFDYQWTQWSVWDDLEVDFSREDTPDEQLILDYQDASTFRFGVDYAVSDRIVARGGFTLADAAASDASVSPFLPEAERSFFSGGIHYRASERLSLDLFAMTVTTADRRGRVVERESFEQTAEDLNDGLYTSDGQIFGGTVTYHFGGFR